jgi:ABC-type multidrug transport system fused ATPase/permease subunit
MEYAFSSPLTPILQGEGDVKKLQEKQIWEALEKAEIADMVRNLEK